MQDYKLNYSKNEDERAAKAAQEPKGVSVRVRPLFVLRREG
nr:MAG TPA: hypothetical protein [Caudoviricetes sp.]